MIKDSQIEALAELVVSKLVERMGAGENPDEVVRGVVNIARFLGVSAKTLRRSHIKKLPVCGAEEFNHRGKPSLRILCKRRDLRAYRDNLSGGKSRLTCKV